MNKQTSTCVDAGLFHCSILDKTGKEKKLQENTTSSADFMLSPKYYKSTHTLKKSVFPSLK